MDTTEDVNPPTTPDDPIDALRARYAAGDLSLDDLEAEIRGIPGFEASAGDDPGPSGGGLEDLAAVLRRPDPPCARLVTAVRAFCDAYLDFTGGR